MSTFLGDVFPPIIGRRPPRVSEPETSIYQRWSKNLPAGVVRSYFDVGLGDGNPAPVGTAKNIRRMWLRNTQKRADVVLEFLDKVAIVELRSIAQSNAIGRLQLYKMLYLRDPVIGTNVEIWLVTDLFIQEVDDLAKLVGVKYIIA